MSSLAAYALPQAHPVLAAMLGEWLPRQRWFQGKARTPREFVVRDVAVLDERVIDVFAEVAFDDGGTECYQIPIAAGSADAAAADVIGRHEDLVLVDATSDAEGSRALAQATLDTRVIRTTGDVPLVGRPLFEEQLEHGDEPQRMQVEQSNTSILFGTRWMLKLFRRLEPGMNPDVEITRELTLAAFPHVPMQHGAWEMEQDEAVTVLAVLMAFVEGAREGWQLAVDEGARVARDEAAGGLVLLDHVADLGRATAALHVALRDAFGAQPAREEDVRRWSERMQQQVDRVLTTAGERAPDETERVRAHGDEIRRRLQEITQVRDAGPVLRIHGDLHLGQVLLDGDGVWQFLDFEGEPARSLAERRTIDTPLRDVAGMLRSFDYAAAQTAHDGDGGGEVQPGVAAWRDALRDGYLEGYLTVAQAAQILPDDDSARTLLDALELDKAVYELGYELANRPTWVPTPVAGILRVLEARTGTS